MNSVLVPVLAEETEPSQEIPQETQIHPDSNDKEGVVVSDEEEDSENETVPEQQEEDAAPEINQGSDDSQPVCPDEIAEKYAETEFEADSEELLYLQEQYPACTFQVKTESENESNDGQESGVSESQESAGSESQESAAPESQESEALDDNEDSLSRAEWIHQIVDLFDLSVAKENYPDNYYSDVSSDTEYYADIMSASQYGVIEIAAGNPFEPEAPVTRDFAAYTANSYLGVVAETEIDLEDADQIPHPEDAKAAVYLQWFAVENNRFEPDQTVSAAEAESIFSSIREILSGRNSKSSGGNGFTFADYVKVIPDGTEIEYPDEDHIIIKDYSGELSKDDVIAVYYYGIAFTFRVDEAEKRDNLYCLQISEAPEDSIQSADYANVVIPEATRIDVDEEEREILTADGGIALLGPVRSISVGEKIKFYRDITIGDVKGTVSGTVSNIWVDLNFDNFGVFCTLNGDIELDSSISISLLSAKTNYIPLGGVSFGPFGRVNVEINYSIAASLGYHMDATFSIGYQNNTKGEGFIKRVNHKPSSGYLYGESDFEMKLAITGELKLSELWKMYATVGVGPKGKIKSEYNYADHPKNCRTVQCYLTAGGYIEMSHLTLLLTKKTYSLNYTIWNERNSPMRIYQHTEDGVRVSKCTRNNPESVEANKYLSQPSSVYYNSYIDNSSSWYGPEEEPIVVWQTEEKYDGTLKIIGYSGNARALYIPDQIDGIDVTEIGSEAFRNNETLQMIFMNSHIIAIGDYAFENCKNIKSVRFSETLKSIGEGAFRNCSSLKAAELPDSLEVLKSLAFQICSGLENVKMPENDVFDTIEDSTFSGCSSLVEINVPDQVRIIGNYSFNNCSSLSSVKLPSSLEEMNVGVLGNCTSLEEITLPKSLSYSEDSWWGEKGPMYGCNNLKTVHFEEGFFRIHSALFQDCPIEEIYLPDSIIEIGPYAFMDCKNLKTVRWPANLEMISGSAFSGCVKLESAVLPDTIYKFGDYAFSGCTNLSEVKIPNEVSHLSAGAFNNCKSLKEIYLPKSISKETQALFTECGVFENSGLERVTFEEGFTVIPVDLFKGCTNLKSITIPDTVWKLENYLFAQCSSLEEVTLPASLTQMGIGVFEDCSSLKRIEIPSGLKTLRESVFKNCSKLHTVILPEGLVRIDDEAFLGCGLLKTINLPETLTGIDYRAFFNCTYLEEIIIPDSVTYLGSEAFYGCERLSEVKLSKSIEDINSQTFRRCRSLTRIEIPEGVKRINENAFTDDTLLSEIVIPESVNNISNTIVSNPKRVTIFGYPGSYAETYANDKQFKFEAITSELTIINQPEDVFIQVGETAQFHVGAAGEGLSYQWQLSRDNGINWVNLNGTKFPSALTEDFEIKASASNNGYLFRCVVSDQNEASVESDSAKLTLEELPALEITSQPEDVTVSAGENAEFHISADGDGLNYQWQLSRDNGINWVNLNGKKFPSALTEDFEIRASASNDGYLFRCVVSDEYGQTVESESTKPTVEELPGPEITSQPEDVTVPVGEYAEFHISAEGEGLSYQWQLSRDNGINWVNLNGKKFPSALTEDFEIKGSTSNNGYLFRCVVSDEYGQTVESESAKLTVEELPTLVITTHPEDAVVPVGEIAEFHVAADGEDLSYQWQLSRDKGLNWVNLNGTKFPSALTEDFEIKGSKSNNTNLFRCVVSDLNGESVTSNSAELIVATPGTLVITSQPEDATAAAGEYAEFHVTAIGEGLSYQWQLSRDNGLNWANLSKTKFPSALTEDFEIKGSKSVNGYLFRCVVSDESGQKVTSSRAKLTVDTSIPLEITSHPSDTTVTIGENAEFHVTAIGTGLKYQWQLSRDNGLNWVNLNGSKFPSALTADFEIKGSKTNNGYLFRCVVSDASGQQEESDSAELTVQ